jgi:hypothetical protein
MGAWEGVGWLIWAAAAFFAFSLSFGCRRYAQAGQNFSWMTAVQAFFFCVIAILFLVFAWNKLHILWIAPLAFLFGQFLVLNRIPIVSALVMFATGLFLRVVLAGVRPIDSP